MAGDACAQALARKKPKTDHQFIRSLYQDLLGRAPGYDELRNMRNALQSMADPAPLRAVMAKVILDSKQAQVPACEAGKEEEFVRECFLRYLGREPTQGEASRYTETLRDPEADPKLVPRALLGSVEYGYC